MPSHDDWTDRFFDGPWIDLHLSLRSKADVRREVDAIASLLSLSKAARLIDIPCGPGDHAIELTRRGHRVTGVDRSTELLEHARRRGQRVDASVDWVVGDMRTFRSDTPFDALICLWGSFGYFDDAGDRAQLQTFHELIRPGGQLLLDMLPLEGILLNFEKRDSRRVGRMIVVQERSYDMLRQRIEGVWTFHLENERVERTTAMRLYTVRETFAMLEAAGFSDITLFDPETLGTFEIGAARTWVRAIRT